MLGNMIVLRRKKKRGTVPVYLNVYDLTPMNVYAYWFGLGIYHSGIQVHGTEYAFGAHDYPTSGIYEVKPQHCPGFTFRKQILVGKTDMGPKEVQTSILKLAEEYSGNSYQLITKNCNHFCNDVCVRLTKKSIPSWVNRLARIGFLFKCLLPPWLTETRVQRATIEDGVREGGKTKKLRSHSSMLERSSTCQLSSYSSDSAIKSSSKQNRCLPRSSSLIHTSSTATTATLRV